jgi:DNA-directed RNA polymerase specialized sigma24 family protein
VPSRKKSDLTEQTPAEERIARLLALLVVRDIEHTAEQVQTLRAAGFGVSQIAQLLGTTENAVSVASYRARQKETRSAPKPPRKKRSGAKKRGE